MQATGNTASNMKYNPNHVQPEISSDFDDSDRVLERYIRQKYDQRSFTNGMISRSTVVADSPYDYDDIASISPPKSSKRRLFGTKLGFNLRSTSFTTLKSDRLRSPTSFTSPQSRDGSLSPTKVNKQSRVLGSSIGNQGDEGDFDAKLARLRDMGFKNSRRNSDVLKSLNGSIQRTVETLVRLNKVGEDDNISAEQFNSDIRSQPPSSTQSAELSPVNQASLGLPTNPVEYTTTRSHSAVPSTNTDPFLFAPPNSLPFVNTGLSATTTTTNPFFHYQSQQSIMSPTNIAPQFIDYNNATRSQQAYLPPSLYSSYQFPQTQPPTMLPRLDKASIMALYDLPQIMSNSTISQQQPHLQGQQGSFNNNQSTTNPFMRNGQYG